MKDKYPSLHSYNTEIDTICAVVLLTSDDSALMQLRDEKPGLNASGLWVFPGGHKEKDEDIWTCAEREFFEETGYQCRQLRWLMQINDSYIVKIPLNLHIFWDYYDGHSAYTCQEGQALEFISRDLAKDYAVPEYLIPIWDLVIIAAKNSKF